MKHLKRWTLPTCYAGAVWPEYYSAGVGQSRDSSTLERSNFRSVLQALGGETDTVLVVHEGHWAVGWVEWIAIHETDTTALAIADTIADRLDAYPIVDEDDWSTLEFETACEYWEGMSVADRVHVCHKHRVCVFAARRSELPDCESGEIVSDLADGC